MAIVEKFVNQLKRQLRHWPIFLSCTSALIPLGMLIFIIVTLFQESSYAIERVGFESLFSTEYHSTFTQSGREKGLLAALGGTILMVGIAIAIALPVSLAMAILSSEFPSGFLGKSIRSVLGVFSGIPPIIYAILGAATIVGLLSIVPGGSSFKGGIVLSLLIIPFMAPLIDDALRDVPSNLKEASLALGATRRYTLIRVTIPVASAGLVSAIAMGILKGMGDLMIAWFVVGVIPDVPTPFWDIMDPGGSLTSAGAGLAGGLGGSGYVNNPIDRSAAYFTGFVLLILAFTVMIAG
ncbi:MAG: ABC transporter permease subunit, partial [Chloroflexota bacterium]|nr:ABC transporter permease subunit [Chloroflexota bacterium]